MCSAPKLRALAALCSLPGHSTPGLRGSLPCPSALCPPGHRLDQAFLEPSWRKETPPPSPRRAPPNPKPFGDRSPQVSQTRTPGSAGPSVRCGCPHEETETYSLSTDGTLREGRAGWPSTCLLRAWSQRAPPRSAGRPGEGFTHAVGHGSSRMSPASPPGGGAFWPWEVKGRGLQEWLRLAPGPSPLPLPHESLGGDTAVPSPGSAGRGAAGCLSSQHQGPGWSPRMDVHLRKVTCGSATCLAWHYHVRALPSRLPSRGEGVGPPAPQLWAPYEEVNSRCLQEPPSHGLRASCAAGGLSMGLPAITRKSVPSDQHPTPRRPAA